MSAIGILIVVIGIFLLINALNGNLPGLIDWPGFHTSTVEFNTTPKLDVTPLGTENPALLQTMNTHA